MQCYLITSYHLRLELKKKKSQVGQHIFGLLWEVIYRLWLSSWLWREGCLKILWSGAASPLEEPCAVEDEG